METRGLLDEERIYDELVCRNVITTQPTTRESKVVGRGSGMRDVAGRCRTAQRSDVSRTLHTRDGKIHRGVGRAVDWQASDGVVPTHGLQGLNTTENFGSDGVDGVDASEKDGRGWRLEAHCKIPLPQGNPGRKPFPVALEKYW